MIEATGPSEVVVSTQNIVKLRSDYGAVTVTTSQTETGSTSAVLTIKYTTNFAFLEGSWFFLTIPKANKDYSATEDSANAISFIDDSNKGSVAVTVGGTSLTIPTSVVRTGSGWEADTWYFTHTGGAVEDIPKEVVITVPIANPMLVSTVNSDWQL